MHNVYPQLGKWDKHLGCYVYEERPQMGELEKFDVEQAIGDALKKVFPNIANTIAQKFLASDEGRALSAKVQNTAYALGREQAEALAAKEIAQREMYWREQLTKIEQNLRENWKKYVFWAGIGVVALTGIYFVIKAAREKA